MRAYQYFVYILTNFSNTTLYIGVTNSLERRALEHIGKMKKGFTQKYRLSKLIYFEKFGDIDDAISREKQLKNWHRQWKINLINSVNSGWYDLTGQIEGEEDPETSSG